MPYSEKVLEHFQHPRNQGSMADADAVGEVGNPVCGDVMKIYLKIRDRRIKDIKFETLGCAAAIAVSSALTEIAKGKSLDQALKIEKDDIVRELGGLPDLKIHCSMLGVEAMRAAIAKYQAGQK
ncbi:iron-sulfur cluster assembly scaffold protein [Candidatus Falkowbacteria bacterium CG_4_10_14_0_2_um_filter_48_10]|uniref:Iron-sulfur cluster assembly scaffold protein n=1 Tax=Candidatus Falkowbacteria bacterium CG23_combo_of_CG06-09_8_20_14_all_49_15 TaxID=1974572 RepID=A0A2G9ZLQ4_9BACT|nr:MAG: iron-sulfur cluster assembly scaffold protein [Candidatus Falkowbacteria bacterium CG23_combo_of_CG06-09_8_20_14_all_49_15]PJA08530.1 MAG: iron-sulfur cluster assembly scaffold protein [Candidatus Falkowbacteria bacterium CG_4_10_14_0_2_um_filter_48_10]